MAAGDCCSENPAVVRTLRARLGDRESCREVVDACQELMASIWTCVARLLSDGGTRAVVAWSIEVAARDAPLLRKLQLREQEVDFGGLQDHAAQVDCDTSELLEAVLRLGVTIFQTLCELTGDTVTGPLLRHLEEG